MKRKQGTPAWLPFAIVASGFVALAAGIKSGFRIGGETAASPPPGAPPTTTKAGVLQDWNDGVVYRA